MIQHLLDSCTERYPEIVREIEKSLYVDVLISRVPTSIFAEGTFEQLRKWHSNVKELEPASLEPVPEEETYAKEQLNIPSREGASLLGLPWDKENDTITVSFLLEKAEPTKRGILSKVARTYDPLGLTSPISLGDGMTLP